MRWNPVLTTLAIASLPFAAIAQRDPHDHRAEEPRPQPRQAAPKWEPHAPGVHPHGATYRSHPVRILRPTVITHGRAPAWKHWEHPEFVRPNYYWDWHAVRTVTCVAEDSYGDQYPVTETWRRGWALDNMTEVEDNALDRCYAESGSDDTCYLATCTHV